MVLLTFEFLLLFIIQISMLLFFITYTLDLNWSRKQILTIIFVVCLPTYLLFPLIGAISILYSLVILSIIVYRKRKTIGHILHIFMALFCLVISENTSYLLCYHLFNGIVSEQMLAYIPYFFFILFGSIFAFFYKRTVKYLIDRWVFNKYVSLILVFLGVATVIFMYINIMAIDHDNFYESVEKNLAMFLIYFVLLAICIVLVLYLAFKQFKMKQREQEMQNFESYVASMEQINQDMRRFKHDYINILSSLRTFIDDQNYDGLHTYFYDHILATNHHEQLNQQAMMRLNNLKIISLKGLLTTKILQAQSHQVPLYIEMVEEITDISVDPIQLNRMVGILLDNAIEAARGIENGEVRIAFIHIDEAILLVVSNTFDEKMNIKVHEIYQEGFSTKGDNRGLGLANLRQMINNLPNVNLNTKISRPKFIQEVAFRKV